MPATPNRRHWISLLLLNGVLSSTIVSWRRVLEDTTEPSVVCDNSRRFFSRCSGRLLQVTGLIGRCPVEVSVDLWIFTILCGYSFGLRLCILNPSSGSELASSILVVVTSCMSSTAGQNCHQITIAVLKS